MFRTLSIAICSICESVITEKVLWNFLVLIIFISSIAVVSASDLNETAGDEIQVSNAIEVEQYADESPINEETNVDDDLIRGV